ETLYAGTDLGVYRSVDAGVHWDAFDAGIPHVVVTDLEADRARGALYAATMGRGMYRVCIAPDVEERAVDIFVRDSVLDVGDPAPVPDGLPNPLRPDEPVFWWQSPDLKVDQTAAPRDLDGVEFDGDIPEAGPAAGRPP